MAKRKDELEEFIDEEEEREIVVSEPVFEHSFEKPVLSQEDVNQIIGANYESKFINLARGHGIGKLGFVAINLSNNEKVVVPLDSVFSSAGKRFSMTFDEYNALQKLTDLK